MTLAVVGFGGDDYGFPWAEGGGGLRCGPDPVLKGGEPAQCELVPESWTRDCARSTLAASDRLFEEVPFPFGTGTSVVANSSMAAKVSVRLRFVQSEVRSEIGLWR